MLQKNQGPHTIAHEVQGSLWSAAIAIFKQHLKEKDLAWRERPALARFTAKGRFRAAERRRREDQGGAPTWLGFF